MERARLTKRVVNKLEAEGKLDEACEMIMEMQVETYGSMEITEKVVYRDPFSFTLDFYETFSL